MRILKRLQIVSLCAVFAASVSNYAQSAVISVKLGSMRQLREGVAEWPLIASPATPAEQRINSTLRHLNQKLGASLNQCDADYRASAKQSPSDTAKNSDGDWERKIMITMVGPRFLSMVATDSQFCGGAYPNADTLALVFDLSTGRPVNWMALIAASAKASLHSDSTYDGTTVGTLIVPGLLKMSKETASADCKDAFETTQSYQLWPDAKTGTLVAEPFGLPHVVAACAEDLSLTLHQARKLGFDKNLLAAINQAHRAGMAASKTGKH